MVVVEGMDHTVRSINLAFCDLTNRTTEELVGQHFCDLLPDEIECIESLDRVFGTAQPENHVEPANPETASLFWSFTMWPVRSHGGTAGVVIAVTKTAALHNDTVSINEALLLSSLRQHELVEAAEMAREQTALDLAEKARLLDLTKDAIIVRDFEDKITLWNKGAENLYGWKCEEVTGRDLHALLQTIFPKPIEEIIAQIRMQGEFSGEVVQTARDGHQIPALCRWVLDRETESILTSYTDITEIKRIEKALEAAHALAASRANELEKVVEKRTADLREMVQQLETFSYSIVHDMRAPLRAMRSFAAALRQEQGDKLNDQGRDYLNRIGASAARMDALITDVLAFSRIGTGETELRRVDLKKLVRDIVNQYPQFQENAEAIDITEPLPTVLGNAALLTQIISNLLGNALKFVPPQRAAHVVIGAEQSEGKVRLCVQDNGIGIAPQYHEKIFELFKRLHRADQFAGTGVGLAIVKKAAERMGGRAGFDSEVGVGSRFWVELNVAE